MRLASYALRGRPSFGVVSVDGIVDLRPRLHRFQNLSEVFRARALDQAKAASDGVRPDVPLTEVELLPPLAAPEKILCIGINYADRGSGSDVTDNPKYPSMFIARQSGSSAPDSVWCRRRFPSTSTTRARSRSSSDRTASTYRRTARWR